MSNTAKVAEERQIKNPTLILGADGSTNKCIIVGIVVEADEELEVESLSKYKNTGQKRVLLLAKADDIPENRENYDILLNSLDLHNVNDNFQVVSDFKLINIIIGIQTCASRYSCPYCIGCKLDLEGNFSIKKGTYSKGALRTWKNIIDENERWLDETGGDRSKLKMFHNFELN